MSVIARTPHPRLRRWVTASTSSARRRRSFVTAFLSATALVGLLAVQPASALSGDVHMHDPSVIKSGGCYYGYSTGFEGGPGNGAVTIRKTCVAGGGSGWTYVGTVWNSVPAWITARLGSTPPNIWAPEIKNFNGQFYLYYAASIWGTSSATMGVLSSASPTGPWTDLGEVTNVNYPIDPDVEWGPNNTLYVLWGSWNGTYMHVLVPSTGKLSTTDNHLWKLSTGIENPSLMFSGGFYYLYGSRGSCCQGVNSTYYTVVGRSTSITGPYLDKTGKDMAVGGGTTVLTGASPQVAAGGGDAYDDGTAKMFAYHYYDANANGRETMNIRPVTFSNGWPVMGAPIS